MAQFSSYYEGVILCTLLPRPFMSSQKLVFRPTRKVCFVLEGSRKVVHFWRWFGSCLIAEFSNKPVWPFPPSSPSPLLARPLERSREFVNRVCQIGRLPANRGEPRISSRWACASQPGFPPLRAQFRFGVTSDWSRFCFLV